MLKLSMNKKGFSLIEATVAIFIMTIGLVSVVQFFPFSLRIVNDSQKTTIALNTALAKAESVLAMDYDEINTGQIESKHRLSAQSSSYLYQYQRETVVETIDSNLDPSAQDIGLKKITITVYWQSPFGEEKSLAINSIIADY